MALTLSGGTIRTFTSGAVNYQSHTFTSSGQLVVTGTGTQAAQILVVGGGGGGSRGGGGETADVNFGNGGGAGGLYYTGGFSFPATYPVWDIAVGSGGRGGSILAGATNGETSSIISRAIQAKVVASSSYFDGGFFTLTGSVAGKFFVTSSITQADAGTIYYVTYSSTAATATANVATKINTLNSTFGITANAVTTNLQLSASIGGTTGNSFRYTSGSVTQAFAGGVNTATTLTGSYGGFGGQPGGGAGASGGGSYPTGAAAIFAESGSAGGNQIGRSGAGGGGASTTGSNSSVVVDPPFAIWNGGDGGAGKAYTLLNGTSSFYAAGGGGGGFVNVGPGSGGTGGSGIGGNGGSGVKGAGKNGAANTGAGGGGGALSEQSGNWGEGGTGGSGIVVITYTV